MPRLIGQGNNIAGALDPAPGAAATLRAPTDLGAAPSVQHHDWTCTVTPGQAWGEDPLAASITAFPGPIARVLTAHDRPAGLLSQRRVFLARAWRASAGEWDDAAATALGPAVGVARGGVYHFASLADLVAGTGAQPLTHPYLAGADSIALTAAEARVLLVARRGAASHVLQLAFSARGGPELSVLEPFEGLGVVAVTGGPGNRFGAVTAAGEGFVLDALGGVEGVRVPRGGGEGAEEEDEEEVAALALGAGFELALTPSGVWARGDNAFGQLGLPGAAVPEWTRMPLPPGRVVGMHAGRMSAVFVVAGGDDAP
ncbi:hypothetical protein Q8F55_008733 [Vanrija albida]|uniref:Cleavage/polyadenylation specificity factor A subunit N-terminal domain-containing protein n=1 Tax=Vanrija albida TaxID=181172 RepID=A0ABR3PRU8_9TREE